MFVLLTIKDTVRLLPTLFDTPLLNAVQTRVNHKYCNKVMSRQGLVISIDGFDEIGDAYVHPGDGAAHIRCTIRLVVFRPLVSEVIVGSVGQSDASGLLVTTPFFHHILVPAKNFPDNSRFDAEKKTWVWWFDKDSDFELYKHDPIRVRVVDVHFAPPKLDEDAHPSDEKEKKEVPADLVESTKMEAMSIIASISEMGLGPSAWWEENSDDEEEADADAEDEQIPADDESPS